MDLNFDVNVGSLKILAEQGDANSMYNLGVAYENGLGGETVDYRKAADYYKQSAELGHIAAKFNLAMCYDLGRGIKQNSEEAFKLWLSAAEAGMPEAQYNVAYCYKNAHGVKKDYAKAFAWYGESAKSGYPQAQYNLGLCYLSGIGTKQDEKAAVEQLRAAANQGDKDALKMLKILNVEVY